MKMVGLAVGIIVIQRIGFAVLASGLARTTFLDALMILANCLAVAGCLVAAARGRRISRIFWLLFACAIALQLVADIAWAWCRFRHISVPDGALLPSLFYRLYAGPMAIALFLPEDVRSSRLESFLDGCIVVGLVGLCVFQVQLGELGAYDPQLWKVITLGIVTNVVLLLGSLVRRIFAARGSLRGLFGRQLIFLSIYSCTALITSIGDAYFAQIDDSIDLIWIVPYLSAAVLAFSWQPAGAEEIAARPRLSRRASLLSFNLTLATMVLACTILGLRLLDPTHIVSLLAITIVLFSYAIRSAMMQDKQEGYLDALKESKAQLQHQALYDELTGLPNRRLFAERLTQTLALARREGHIAAMIYIDLDGFKLVNDRLGHAIGDLLLRSVARRMMNRTRESDTLARMGGDEFTLLLAHVSGKEYASIVAAELAATLSEPLRIEGHSISVGASLGVSIFPDGASDAASLIHQADCAMYAAKRAGGNSIRCYTPELEEGAGTEVA